MQKDNPLRVAVIIGSIREGRFAPTVARWFATEAALRTDMTFDVIDLAEVRLPEQLTHQRPAEVAEVGRRLAAADAFVVISPEYNHSFPAALKNAIDWFNAEWQRKPVSFISYGGASGGVRATEQLRQVFAELRTATIRNTISFQVGADFDPDGIPRNLGRSGRAAAAMLEELAWWGRALRDARARDEALSSNAAA